MEKWKIGVIAALLLGLVGYGISQQNSDKPANIMFAATPGSSRTKVAPGENKAAKFIGRTFGSDKLPEWKNVGSWENSKKPVTLGLFKNEVAMVEFFSVDCSHCQEATPFMEALYQRYRPRGLKMVAIQSPIHPKNISGDETQWPKVRSFITAAGLTYPVGMDKGSQYFQQTIGGANYPTTMLADRSGVVVHAQTGYNAREAISLAIALEKQLPGPGTPKARAAALAKFLRPFTFGSKTVDPLMTEALTDDLEQLLMGKV